MRRFKDPPQRQPNGGAGTQFSRAKDPKPAEFAQRIGNQDTQRLLARSITPAAADPLPHRETIERSFGAGHDLASVRDQVGGTAAAANALLSSSAFTKGENIAFSRYPSLDEVAHEAAHVVQQRQR